MRDPNVYPLLRILKRGIGECIVIMEDRQIYLEGIRKSAPRKPTEEHYLAIQRANQQFEKAKSISFELTRLLEDIAIFI